MALLKFYKQLSVPSSAVADAVYAVKNGAGFDWYISSSTSVLFPMNAPAVTGISQNMGTWTLPSFDQFKYPVCSWNPATGTAVVPASNGFAAFTNVGTLTAGAVTNVSGGSRRRKLGIVSAATVGSLASSRHAAGLVSMGAPPFGGFVFTGEFGCGDTATVANARQFCGLISSTTAATNVEPSTLTYCIGIGNGAGNTTLRLFYGGSTPQTPIDLGANFPASVSVAVAPLDMYKLTVYAPQDPIAAGFKLAWHVARLGTAFTASGTITTAAGSTVPDTSLMLNPNNWRTNNATALAVSLQQGPITLQALD